MFDYELQQAVAQLGGFLESLPRLPAAERARESFAWDAPALLGRLLHQATFDTPPLDRGAVLAAALEFNRERARAVDVGDLERRGWLRFVLGRVEAPIGARRPEPGAPSGHEDEIEFVKGLTQRGAPRLVVTRDIATGLIARHAAAHEETPTLEHLLARGALVESAAGLLLKPNARASHDLWRSCGAEAAAVLWRLGPKDVRGWLDRARDLPWGDAAIHMSEEDSTTFLDAARNLIETEADIVGFDAEPSRMILEESGALAMSEGERDALRPAGPPPSSPLSRWRFWEALLYCARFFGHG